jgi:hypothetical protein
MVRSPTAWTGEANEPDTGAGQPTLCSALMRVRHDPERGYANSQSRCPAASPPGATPRSPAWRMAVTSSSGRTAAARTIPTARPSSSSDTIHSVTRSVARSRSANSPRETNERGSSWLQARSAFSTLRARSRSLTPLPRSRGRSPWRTSWANGAGSPTSPSASIICRTRFPTIWISCSWARADAIWRSGRMPGAAPTLSTATS